MPPARRTRARARMILNQPSITGENISVSTTTNSLQGSRRTLTSTQTSTTTDPTPPATNGRYEKKTRKTGPTRGRPMQLELTNEDEGVDQQQICTAIDNGGGSKRKGPKSSERILVHHLQHRPSAGNANLPPTSPRQENEDDGTNGNSTDSGAETEEDWLDSSQLAELARRFPSRMSEAMVIERPLWDDLADVTGSNLADVPTTSQGGGHMVTSTNTALIAVVPAAVPPVVPGSTFLPIVAPTPTFVPTSTPEPALMSTPEPTPMPIPMPMPVPVPVPVVSDGDDVWPADTELIYVAGTTRVMLTAQRPVMRTVIQNAFENIRASLLFNCALPDASIIPSMVRDALVAAAWSNMPRASNIHGRLLMDEVYVARLSRLPRARIPIFRGEVKECCASIVQIGFLMLARDPGQSIAQVVEKQLSHYYYTYPVSGRGNPLTGLPLRTRPYRNLRIIAVIRQLYFEGGTTSFVQRFDSQFPRHVDEDGATIIEVPIPMVALVATALYAAIYEWRTGQHQPKDFSTNTFMDVYQGHIDTFNHIREHRNSAFQLMMGDIYALANASTAIGVPGVSMAQIDLNELEG